MPVTPSDANAAAAALGFSIPKGHEKDYLALLANTERCCLEVMSIPDYTPAPDTILFPRLDVHQPLPEENTLKAWAWKCTIPGDPDGKLLRGRTFCAKDTVCVAGVPQLFGTDAFLDFVPTVDATLITRLLKSGATFVGKAACENFSHGAASFSSPYGPVQNPYAHGFSTGGSSSGCGALIGSGEVEMGIGGDQGGSIRIPASLCGIVGHKPTFGLVPYTGVLSSEPAVDTVGPMARTCLDAALLLQSIAGYDSIDDRQVGAPLPADVPKYSELVLASRVSGVKGLKIGVLKEGFQNSAMDARVEICVRNAVQKFKDLGAELEDVSVPLHEKAGAIGHIINKFASSQTRQGRQVGRKQLYLNDYWTKLLPWNQEKYDKAKYFVTGTSMSAEYGWMNFPVAYGRAMNLARQMRDQYNELLSVFDVIVLPTMPQPARRHALPDAGPLAWTQASPGAASNTAAFNLTGHPALTIPVGWVAPMEADLQSPSDRNLRLPVGMMIVGKMFDDATVLKVGDTWEQNCDWKQL